MPERDSASLAPKKFVERGSNRLVVEQADDHLFNDGQHDQQHEECERPMQGRPDQWAGGVALAKVHRAADQHEFRQHCGFDNGKPQ